MVQWMFQLGQIVTVDVVNLDVLSRHPCSCQRNKDFSTMNPYSDNYDEK
jgi:hypothetical protein